MYTDTHLLKISSLDWHLKDGGDNHNQHTPFCMLPFLTSFFEQQHLAVLLFSSHSHQISLGIPGSPRDIQWIGHQCWSTVALFSHIVSKKNQNFEIRDDMTLRGCASQNFFYSHLQTKFRVFWNMPINPPNIAILPDKTPFSIEHLSYYWPDVW